MSNKIAIFLPGIGYSCDRPLMYYTESICRKLGYTIVRVPYSGFPKDIFENRWKLKKVINAGYVQTEAVLASVDLCDCDDILFVGKSIGTAIALRYMEDYEIKGRSILYTPIPETLDHIANDTIVFHGTNDPWMAMSEELRSRCDKEGFACHIFEGADHSLEVGDIDMDLQILKRVMALAKQYIVG